MDNLVKQQLRDIFFGGACETILTSTKTGTQFTYKIRSNKQEQPNAVERTYYISVGTKEGIQYAGYIRVNFMALTVTYVKGRKGAMLGTTQEIQALMWVLKRALKGLDTSIVTVQHCGKCAICGKRMTDDESSFSGIGPNCRQRLVS